ncbi:hypothetical protein Dip518_000635 [Parelusimicrobium proximum]
MSDKNERVPVFDHLGAIKVPQPIAKKPETSEKNTKK